MSNKPLFLSALSGGADSTAMLLMLIERGWNVEAVHCNFHLRGEESDRDEMFCRQLCDENGIKLHIVHFDTTSYAHLHHESIETAARNLRYNYFFNLAHDIGAHGVCIAHNRNDQAETLLMNLVRGAGIHGLSGMRAEKHILFKGSDIVLLRPLLGLSRDEIEDFLVKRGQKWVTDSTNLTTEATRNKFRLEVIPILEKINPHAIENIANASKRLQSVADVYDKAVEQGINHVSIGKDVIKISKERLMKEVSPEAVLYEIMSRLGFNGRQVDDVISHINGNSGRQWLCASHQLVVDRDDIIIAPLDEMGSFEIKIPEEGTYVVAKGKGKIRIKSTGWGSGSVIPKNPFNVALDSKNIGFPLVLRTIRRGDKFHPLGMKGGKLVSDFLTDNKLSLIDKQRQLILTDSEDRILWLVGLRPDNRFRITAETAKALLIEYQGSGDSRGAEQNPTET